MSERDFEKGEYVITTVAGQGNRVQGYGTIAFEADQELIVTSKTSNHLNVRHAGGGRVFRIPRGSVIRRTRKLGEAPEGAIAIDDPGLDWLWEDAGRLANRLGYCAQFDRLAEMLGAPGRERTFTLKLSVSEGVEVTAKVRARSKKLAELRVIEQFAAGVTPEIRAITA